MMRTLLLVAVLFLLSCAEKKKEPDVGIVEGLKDQATLYKALIKTHQDKDGFILTDKCDSLLFSALANPTINLAAAEVEPGKWLRRPTSYAECWESDESASTISRDMLLGVMWRAWKQKDLALLERMYSYGERHKWFMGSGDLTATCFSPVFVSTLAQAIYKLGGSDYTIRNLAWTWNKKETGYKAHIQALHILIRREVYGKISNDAVDALERMSDRNRSNALYLALLGRYEEAAVLLKEIFPEDRLPSKAEWCEEWRWQREETDESLKPCPTQEADTEKEELTHSGGDFLFIYELLGGT
jgi:hypothetical protein